MIVMTPQVSNKQNKISIFSLKFHKIIFCTNSGKHDSAKKLNIKIAVNPQTLKTTFLYGVISFWSLKYKPFKCSLPSIRISFIEQRILISNYDNLSTVTSKTQISISKSIAPGSRNLISSVAIPSHTKLIHT